MIFTALNHLRCSTCTQDTNLHVADRVPLFFVKGPFWSAQVRNIGTAYGILAASFHRP